MSKLEINCDVCKKELQDRITIVEHKKRRHLTARFGSGPRLKLGSKHAYLQSSV